MTAQRFESIKYDADKLREWANTRGWNMSVILQDQTIIDLVHDSLCSNGKIVDIHTEKCSVCYGGEKC